MVLGQAMGLNILVVDDAAFVRDAIKRVIRQFAADIQIFEAVDGRKAMSVMKGNRIDLILSDWEMPEVSGEELLQWVRAHPSYGETPFVMVTSRGDRDNVVVAVSSGVNDYLTKPFTPDELKLKLIKQFKRIGYTPKRAGASSGTHASSVGVLTGSAKPIATKPTAASGGSLAALTGGAAQAAQPKKAPAASGNFDGKAVLRFPECQCDVLVKELSLQAMAGIMKRPDPIPRLFEQAAVDLEDAKGEIIGRLNAYVHSMQAGEPRPGTERIRITVRFVDNDPAKFEALSKAIT